MTGLERFLDLLEWHGCRPVQRGDQWSARCPCHEDAHASLSFGAGEKQPVVARCHAGGCGVSLPAILDRLGATPQERSGILGQRNRRSETHPPAGPEASYEYLSRDGARRLRKLRFPGKHFVWQRLDAAGWRSGLDGAEPGLYRSKEVRETIEGGETIYVAEGERDVDSLQALGLEATCNAHGAGNWRADDTRDLQGARRVVIFEDNDHAGREHAELVGRALHAAGVRVRRVSFPDLPEHGDVSDWLARRRGEGARDDELRADLERLTEAAEAWGPGASATIPPTVPEKVEAPVTLPEVLVTFGRWLYLEDIVPLLVVLAAVVANLRLPGEPVWVLVVGASGGGKTEILRTMSALPRVLHAATLTEAALLSGSPKRDHAKDACGGLLRQIGERGVIVFKDFTSILSQNKDARAQVLAALRELFDGAWTRHIGTDGGRTLSWTGHVGIVAACTPTIDRHHGVIAALGERFLMLRLVTARRRELARRALAHKGRESTMRADLTAAVVGLFSGLGTSPRPMSDAEGELLVGVADFAARARSAVERDGISREIELISDPEVPTRITVTLSRLRDGLLAIGVSSNVAMNIVCRVALDSIPALRRAALDVLSCCEAPRQTKDVALALGHPTGTVRRTLEDLCGLGLVERIPQGKADGWVLTADARAGLATFPDKSSYTEKEILEAVGDLPPSAHPDLSGTVHPTAERGVPEPDSHADATSRQPAAEGRSLLGAAPESGLAMSASGGRP